MSAKYDRLVMFVRMVSIFLIGFLCAGCSSYSKEQKREMQQVRDSVTADPAGVNRPDARGNTPLQLAVIQNYLPLIQWLKDNGADLNARGRYGDTALHTAIISDRTPDNAVMRMLLRMGADINATNDYGETPLHRAAYHGLTEKAQLLLASKADVSHRAQRGETPLLYASAPQGYPDMVLALLKAGADANAVDNAGMTPLHAVAMIGNVNAARVLVENGNADLNRQSDAGYTPLHIAALSGKTEFVQFLLEKGANPKLRDKQNLTAAERAARFPAFRYSKKGREPVDTVAVVKTLKEFQGR